MENEEGEKWGMGKTAVVFTACLSVFVAYYVFLDWVMMVPIQNLPFPYR